MHIARRPDGIVLRGAKAIVTGAPYMHELLVMPCRNMTRRTATGGVLRGSDRCARPDARGPAGDDRARRQRRSAAGMDSPPQ